MRFLMILTVAFLMVPPFELALAQGHSAFCGQADSTAASQDCLKRHLDSAQRRLNKTYQKLTQKLEGEELAALKDLQATWLTYRDAECMWEADRSLTAPFKRVNELSCMARVTEDRLDLLNVALDDDSVTGAQREYGSFPRWMNVIAKENPGVVWDYGRRNNRDLNCDDEDEYIMTGFTTSSVKTPNVAEGEDPITEAYFAKEVVVALAQNPPSGRPQAQIFKFPVQNVASADGICDDEISIDYSERAAAEKSEEAEIEDEEIACGKIIEVKNKGCEPKIISWTGEEFILEIEETTEDNQKEEKE